MPNKHLLSIGVMTGNSLDGVDVVLTQISEDGQIKDLAAHSEKNPDDLTAALKDLRLSVQSCLGDVVKAEEYFEKNYKTKHGTIEKVHSRYLASVADCIKALLSKVPLQEKVDLIGLHGQTCTHVPPSVAGSSDPDKVYTVQFGDGQELADLTGITVVCDFRSDDLMNGGEAAPLAPLHHEHLALQNSSKNFPIIFCNGGNTGNISIVSEDLETGKPLTLGWDTGPFNHYPDTLMCKEKKQSCDYNGQLGMQGKVMLGILQTLFDKAALTKAGENFILKPPPKSSDPTWYFLVPELTNDRIFFPNRLRAAEYFSAYSFFYNLTLIPANIKIPIRLALCGGGWKNATIRLHFEALLKGDHSTSPVLAAHKKLFEDFLEKNDFEANLSSHYGFDEESMEARIFADAAVCKIKNEPFSRPDVTGVKSPCVLGLVRFPKSDQANATGRLNSWIEKYKPELKKEASSKWSRAAAGWKSS